ncbi:MAG: serine hydrolase domain-containing protein [Inconstantimicrobium porci]|uniref:serine hydrolase domain-containing protein n=1 Tax=Inconstantimicrobium porci TaxID=2652291 RepID=UPI002A909AC0|nr:serine hydrolase domain-containing protein [Inconstantimicrobium porci]MDY5910674.1 serine hydrolase domain-containing protein [Inconstantimicrobium porci]
MNETEIKINKVNNYLNDVITCNKIPGAVICIGRGQEEVFFKEYGYRQVYPERELMHKDTLFDIASLSKVVSTWPCIMHLIDEGKIALNQRITDFLGDDINEKLKDVTIKNLLTHTSGLSERTYLKQFGNNKDDIIRGLLNDKLQDDVNSKVAYSNRGFIILGIIVEQVSGMALDEYAKKNIWQPMGMYNTTYNPQQDDNIAATEYIAEKNIVKKGIVHDENAEVLGGVAGHAGVFSTASDLAKFCRNILNKSGSGLIIRALIEESFKNQTEGMNESRGLGWQIINDDEINVSLVGHLGFTGTSIWIEPQSGTYVVLLTNRVHPSRDNTNIQEIRKTVRRIVFRNNR